MGYDNLKAHPLQSPLLVLLDQAIGCNIAMNFSPHPSSCPLATTPWKCICSDMVLSMSHR